MTDGQIVRSVFSMFMAYEEHECREHFTFGGVRIFGPHITLKALMKAGEGRRMRTRVEHAAAAEAHVQAADGIIGYPAGHDRVLIALTYALLALKGLPDDDIEPRWSQ